MPGDVTTQPREGDQGEPRGGGNRRRRNYTSARSPAENTRLLKKGQRACARWRETREEEPERHVERKLPMVLADKRSLPVESVATPLRAFELARRNGTARTIRTLSLRPLGIPGFALELEARPEGACARSRGTTGSGPGAKRRRIPWNPPSIRNDAMAPRGP